MGPAGERPTPFGTAVGPWPAQAAEMDELVDVLIEVPGRCTRPGVDRSRRRWHSGGAAAARPVVHNVSRAELQERRWGPATAPASTRRPGDFLAGATRRCSHR